MKVLITGAAGFIGAALARRLLESGYSVTGIDNLNSYYDNRLKLDRLQTLGIDSRDIREEKPVASSLFPEFTFIKCDICNDTFLSELFSICRFDYVVNLAAQAGVRYSLENPASYIRSNIVGFLNILECCRRFPPRHLVYASSSSVYGESKRIPYSEEDSANTPVSLYAATKKSDEMMAYAYSHLYGLRATGLRFFTVYGPWGRPDMAPFIFLKNILEHRPLRVFNHGDMSRDFTYIDDIVTGVVKVMESTPEQAHYSLYNIGRSHSVPLMDFIHTIEEVSGEKGDLRMEPMQPGDVCVTYADTSRLRDDFGYAPSTTLREGLTRFYTWYRQYTAGRPK